MSVLTKGRNFLLFIGVCYVGLLLALMNPRVQRELFYLNSVKFPWLVDTSRPETCGFSPDRVTSFLLPTGAHAWHVKPLHDYRADGLDRINRETAKLVIYLHGTAGTLAVPHRLTTYRVLSALPDVHVLALDYRGYGIAKGIPSESGLIEDGISAVMWALEQGFSASHITLFGQSLGSAVAIAVAHELACERSAASRVQVGHIVSVAGFYTASDVVKTYRIGGYIPILSPMRTYPVLQRWLIDHLYHKWDSASRVRRLAAHSQIKLTFAHALSDTEILSSNSEQLFMEAVDARANSTEAIWIDKSVKGATYLSSRSLKDGGRAIQAGQAGSITFLELAWGAHNLVQWNDELLYRI